MYKRQDLDQFLAAFRIAGQEIHLEACFRADVGDVRAAPFQFQQHAGLQGVAPVGAARAVEHRNQAGIDRIGFARIDHAPPFGLGREGNGPDQEGVFQIAQISVQRVLGDRNALRSQIVVAVSYTHLDVYKRQG